MRGAQFLPTQQLRAVAILALPPETSRCHQVGSFLSAWRPLAFSPASKGQEKGRERGLTACDVPSAAICALCLLLK